MESSTPHTVCPPSSIQGMNLHSVTAGLSSRTARFAYLFLERSKKSGGPHISHGRPPASNLSRLGPNNPVATLPRRAFFFIPCNHAAPTPMVCFFGSRLGVFSGFSDTYESFRTASSTRGAFRRNPHVLHT
ncbi:hypothetical protein SODALDRAFT_361461 [Sodiomyces alkalinus F11]|uniref:Uncharacterized protein n=1 Tax=Sodiomyces alkalinus (strain CBS 110278 / VKM F-3762 / F11) TaxID=1314773 RepID=A0A3N2PTS5_SODAK|nr:hypothetical protein SODALDRAFT_361461 [Sodiomyces alkalinus F11]ROT37726.1 hypothetical protein SODALDRAFT_361461 [Sodiomyces alkalinus F11]